MKKYVILSVIIILINFGLSFLMPSGGIYADSLSYFEIATDLPNPVTNLFPLGYPAALRLFFGIFRDYFWAAKVLNTTMIFVVMLFSYCKRFYFKETVLLLAGKTCFFVFSIAISESLFVFLLYFLLYYLYQILQNKALDFKNILLASVLMFLLFATRYSGIYVYLSIGMFFVYQWIVSNNKKELIGVVSFLMLSGLGIGSYLFFNYTTFCSFTGENLRGKPEEILPIYVLRDLLGTANVIDPYIGLKPSSNSFASLAFQFLVLILDIFIFLYILKFLRRAKETLDFSFHQLLWIITIVYAVCLIVSGWFQQIEEMNVRMMAAANVCLFFSFLILYFKYGENDKLIFRIGCFFLAFFTLYTLKNPMSYYKNRKQIEPQMLNVKRKKYLYNNERGGEEAYTTYTIPLINRSFRYKHTNYQKGDIKQSIIGTLNPKIKWQKYDTIKDKSSVLYTSEFNMQ